MSTNERYDEITKRTDKIIELRVHAQDIADYANKELANCSFISCLDCLMNIGESKVVCISQMIIIR